MKKTFSIVFVLVLVVGLGLMTAVPVLADASPGWMDIDSVAAGHRHTVGLESDGTVVAVGSNSSGVPDVGGWVNIKQVTAGGYHTAGVKNDGTVVAVGENYNGQCNVGNWTNMKQVAGGGWHTVGVRNDGTVIAVGNNINGQCNVNNWTGINQTSAGGLYTVGLKSGGTVVAVGDNYYGQCNVGNWTGITQVAAGYRHTVGLKSDGTVVAVGDNSYGQCSVGNWTGIAQVAAGYYHTVGVSSGGTVVAVGDNEYGQCGGIVTERIEGYGIVNAIVEADTTVVVTGNATVTIFKYDSNPHPGAPVDGALASLDFVPLQTNQELNIFRDVRVTNITEGTWVEIRLYYTDAQAKDLVEDTLRPYWNNGTAWIPCSPESGVNMTPDTIDGRAYSGYMWTKIRDTGTTPSLPLPGSEFGGYGHPSTAPGGFCFIATAAYGTDTAKELDILREFRDTVLLPNSLGAKLVSFYYRTSPPIANFISQHEVLRTAVRVGFVDPVVRILTWTRALWSGRGS